MSKKNNKTKALELLRDKKDKQMFSEVLGFLEKSAFGMSPIQIQNFVLNDIEFPTAFGKFEQAKFELSHRYQQLLDLYYDVRENEIKIEMKERELKREKDLLKI